MASNLITTILGDYVKIVSIDGDRKKLDVVKSSELVNDSKLKNNLIRAKNKIIDIGLCNDFKYYFTLTFSTDYDRYRLDVIYNLFRKYIHYMRKKVNHRIDYLIVPEQHKDGAWHFHGFFNSGIEEFIYVNEKLFLDIRYLNNLGWVNVQPIKNKIKISHYIVKYVQKNLGKNIGLNNHCYYASTGLKKGVKDIDIQYDNKVFDYSYFDYKTDFCFKKIITLEEYNKIRPFLTKL